MKTKLQIKDVIKETGLDSETLRFYEQKGLFPEPTRTESGYRQFDPEIVHRIQFIKTAQEVGFSLKEISELLNLGENQTVSKAQLKAIADAKIEVLDQKIESLKKMRALLKSLSDRALTLPKNTNCQILAQFKKLEL